jgi:hypothetical protein
MAKSGHLSSQSPQPVQASGLVIAGLPSSLTVYTFVGQKAIQIPQPLHHFSLISISTGTFATTFTSFSSRLSRIVFLNPATGT